MNPLTTLGALAAHMREWDGSADQASAQAALAADLTEQLRHRAVVAYRHEAVARTGLACATDDELAEQSVRGGA